ncbi:hypothetical protein SNEBB_000005 [Seison nebaliae]|nr:hypothetical protein SNEBB_000005 [Seison nebaliae]
MKDIEKKRKVSVLLTPLIGATVTLIVVPIIVGVLLITINSNNGYENNTLNETNVTKSTVTELEFSTSASTIHNSENTFSTKVLLTSTRVILPTNSTYKNTMSTFPSQTTNKLSSIDPVKFTDVSRPGTRSGRTSTETKTIENTVISTNYHSPTTITTIYDTDGTTFPSVNTSKILDESSSSIEKLPSEKISTSLMALLSSPNDRNTLSSPLVLRSTRVLEPLVATTRINLENRRTSSPTITGSTIIARTLTIPVLTINERTTNKTTIAVSTPIVTTLLNSDIESDTTTVISTTTTVISTTTTIISTTTTTTSIVTVTSKFMTSTTITTTSTITTTISTTTTTTSTTTTTTSTTTTTTSTTTTTTSTTTTTTSTTTTTTSTTTTTTSTTTTTTSTTTTTTSTTTTTTSTTTTPLCQNIPVVNIADGDTVNLFDQPIEDMYARLPSIMFNEDGLVGIHIGNTRLMFLNYQLINKDPNGTVFRDHNCNLYPCEDDCSLETSVAAPNYKYIDLTGLTTPSKLLGQSRPSNLLCVSFYQSTSGELYINLFDGFSGVGSFATTSNNVCNAKVTGSSSLNYFFNHSGEGIWGYQKDIVPSNPSGECEFTVWYY